MTSVLGSAAGPPPPCTPRRPRRPQQPPQHRRPAFPQPAVGGRRLPLLYHLLPHHLPQFCRQASHLFLELSPCGNPLLHEVFLPLIAVPAIVLDPRGEHLIYFAPPIPF